MLSEGTVDYIGFSYYMSETVDIDSQKDVLKLLMVLFHHIQLKILIFKFQTGVGD